MEKFLSITVSGLGQQYVSVAGVKLVDEATSTSTTTTIHYMDGTITTITHAADTGFSVLLALQTAMVSALSTNWQNPVWPVNLSVAVSGIANA